MLAGITEVLIISTIDDLLNFEKLLDDGFDSLIKFSHLQMILHELFTLGKEFIGKDDACLVL
jgi:glucose-1-phosphate thymidylyltransferase